MNSRERAPVPTLRATYRIQFGPSFGFEDARALVPYLRALGVSHLYASPLLAAKPGSTHGYDTVDHGRLNPELGDPAAFDALVTSLHREGMGLLLDFVPNHMGVGTDNPWWMDILEWGPRSPCSRFFDIDWEPWEPSLRGRILLPVLGERYGTVLHRGELRPELDRETGTLGIRHGEERYPLAPGSYPHLLRGAARRATGARVSLEELAEALATVGPDGGAASGRGEDPEDGTEGVPVHPEEREAVGRLKRRLAELLRGSRDATRALTEELEELGGRKGEPGSFDGLHALLERQWYRLASWRVAAHEINYRRFFDIPDLAGLRMENPELFRESHALLLHLIREGKVNGLRLDHVDGLRDPQEYLEALRSRLEPGWVVVEKILAPGEELHGGWPVEGTTGYEFLAAVNGLQTDPKGEGPLTRLQRSFTGEARSFRRVAEECRRTVMEEDLVSELNALTHRLTRLAKGDRGSRDFTFTGLRRALVDVVAHFHVYRTYFRAEGRDRIRAEDRTRLREAVDRARREARRSDGEIYEFLYGILSLEVLKRGSPSHPPEEAMDAALRFQQYTSPVAAKAEEDTAFYRHLRLASLNEVGGHPERFGVDPGEFHRMNRSRLQRHPFSLIATATHDHKRGEDVRARLAVLSEMPGEWARRVRRWRRMNAGGKVELASGEAPGASDEYLFYQTLVGCWPPGLSPGEEGAWDEFRERLLGYAEKGAREAGLRTSWRMQDQAYEEGLAAFLGRALDSGRRSRFLTEAGAFAERIARPGVVNSLSQVVLRITSPGVPDTFQGTEFWDLTLVDPDNRRPVDFQLRARKLEARPASPEEWAALLEDWRSGEVKQHLLAALLELRRSDPALFLEGDYLPAASVGPERHRVVAFARRRGKRTLLVVVPRLVGERLGEEGLPLPRGWGGTEVMAPHDVGEGDDGMGGADPAWRDLLTGKIVEGRALSLDRLLQPLPVAVLERVHPG